MLVPGAFVVHGLLGRIGYFSAFVSYRCFISAAVTQRIFHTDDMKPTCVLAVFIFLISLGSIVVQASDTPLIGTGTTLLQSPDRLEEAWNEISSDKRKVIQSYLLNLGLSSTGRIRLIGSFRQSGQSNQDRRILQFQQEDLQGTRLYWSVLVDPDALEARVIFSLPSDQLSPDFQSILTKQ